MFQVIQFIRIFELFRIESETIIVFTSDKTPNCVEVTYDFNNVFCPVPLLPESSNAV